MSEAKKVFVDSDAFVALFYEPDLLHTEAVRIFEQIHKKSLILSTSNTVIAETATVLSNRVGQTVSLAFLELVEKYHRIFVDEDATKKSLEFFKLQKGRGVSFVDFSNVVMMREHDIHYIFSFDKFYKNQSGIQMPSDAGLI